MPVVEAVTDQAARRIRLVSDLDAPPERAWDLWASPGRLARWWGPPGWPMDVEHHDLRPGGEVRFTVTGPHGEVVAGRFAVVAVEAPHALRFAFHTDGGLDDPALVTVAIVAVDDGRSRMTVTIDLASDAAVAQAAALGFDRGVRRSLARADAALA